MTQQIQDAYIVAAVRTPVGKAFRGVYRHTRPDDLLTHCIKALLKEAPDLDPAAIEDVIVGCAFPEKEQGVNVARTAALMADLPDSVPGMTVNRFCSSGVQSVALAAERIKLGEADVIIAGGTESMTMIPMAFNAANPEWFTNNEHIKIAYGMGITAEFVARQWEISREQQDEFAFESHKRALAAIAKGEFEQEIAPLDVTQQTPNLKTEEIDSKTITVSIDEGPRSDTTVEKLGQLRSVFSAKGTVTAGNSSQMSDGAGALLVVSEKALKTFNLTPLAKFNTFKVVGVPPEIMGIGPSKAIPMALEASNLSLADMDWIELNEAFAAQSLAVIKDLDLDRSKVNPLGGAIALGHPLGATGAIRSATCVHALKRHNLKYGMVTMCIGTGMGAAGIYEAV